MNLGTGEGQDCLLLRQIFDIRSAQFLVFSNLSASWLGLWYNVRSCTFSLNIASATPQLNSCASSSHASEDRVVVATCDTNAAGLPILSEDELDLTWNNNATGFPELRVAELQLSWVMGHDPCKKLCSTWYSLLYWQGGGVAHTVGDSGRLAT